MAGGQMAAADYAARGAEKTLYIGGDKQRRMAEEMEGRGSRRNHITMTYTWL